MMRAEDVREILGRKTVIRSAIAGWKYYLPIFWYPEMIPHVIKDNPLVIVHPGYEIYSADDSLENTTIAYQDYIENLRRTVAGEIWRNRTILVYTPKQDRKGTLDALDISKKIILIPTKGGSADIDEQVASISETSFYRSLSWHIKTAEICGEYDDQCVEGVEARLRLLGNVKTKGIKELLYSSL